MQSLSYSCGHLTVAIVLLTGSPAMSEPSPEKALRDEALRLMEQGRIADARETHLSLWRLARHEVDAFNVGMLSYRIHDWSKAAEYLTLWFDLVTPPKPKDQNRLKYEQARVDLEQAREHVGAIEVQVSNSGAEVLVDGRRVGFAPLKYPVFVLPGEHRLRAKQGSAEVERVIKAEAGSEQSVRLALPTPHPEPTLTPRATMSSPSEHATPESAKSGARPRWITVTMLATPVVLSVVGVVALAAANGADDDRTAAQRDARRASPHDCPGGAICDAFKEADGHADTLAAVAMGAFVGAGISAVGAAVYLAIPAGPVKVKADARSVTLITSF